MRLLKHLSPKWRQMIRVVVPLSFLGLIPAGCSTLMTATAPDISLACATYGNQVNYSGSRDTAETVRQIAVRNKAFVSIGCYNSIMSASGTVLKGK